MTHAHNYDDYAHHNSKARPPSSYEDMSSNSIDLANLKDQDLDMLFEDEEQQYQEEMRRREQNIINSFLVDTRTGQKVGANNAVSTNYQSQVEDFSQDEEVQ